MAQNDIVVTLTIPADDASTLKELFADPSAEPVPVGEVTAGVANPTDNDIATWAIGRLTRIVQNAVARHTDRDLQGRLAALPRAKRKQAIDFIKSL